MVDQTAAQSEYEFNWQNPNYVKPQYQVGRVISRTYKGLLKQKKPIGLAILTYVALNAVLTLLSYAIAGQAGLAPDTAQNSFVSISIVLAIMSGLVGWFGIVFVMIITDAAIFSEYTKREAVFKTLARTALRKMVPLTFGLIIFFLAYYIGLFLLIIPGIFVYYGWCVFGPVYVNEDKGLFASFGRSWNLMSGYKRWYFVSSFVIGLINALVFLVILMALFLPLMPYLTTVDVTDTPDLSTGYLAFFSIAYMFAIMLYAVLMASMTTANYLEVKQLKEGAGADVADVFI